jgi:hypothetical protein
MYLFPAPKSKGKPWGRSRARGLLEYAEKATERKHLTDKDVMAAGGWKDQRSLHQCYQDIYEETLYRVVSEPRKLRGTK